MRLQRAGAGVLSQRARKASGVLHRSRRLTEVGDPPPRCVGGETGTGAGATASRRASCGRQATVGCLRTGHGSCWLQVVWLSECPSPCLPARPQTRVFALFPGPLPGGPQTW